MKVIDAESPIVIFSETYGIQGIQFFFFTCNNLFTSDQYVFRKSHSTDAAILKVYDRVSSALADHKHVIGMFMDLSKAFDTLDHAILLSKLQHYGVRGVALNWFSSYLSNRCQ